MRAKPAAERALCRLAHNLSWAYLFLLFLWLVAYLLSGDRNGYLAAINLLAVYLFYPLPLVLLAAWICRRTDLLAGFAVGLLAFIWLWGALFVPKLGRAQASGPVLSVMTFNVLAWHDFTAPILDTIRAEDPDIVFLQELNFGLAEALEKELALIYPYQVLEPAANPSGIGVISKYPVRPAGERRAHRWIGGPIQLEMDWQGQTVTLVNFHMYPTTGFGPMQAIARTFRIREEQAQILDDLAASAGPAIMGGDANSAPLNDAYKILTRHMGDAWQAAGFGLGHTFPGSAIPGSDRPHIGGWYVPSWLVRIDYIFYSPDWETVSARLAKVDGVSDHRGVFAVLRLK